MVSRIFIISILIAIISLIAAAPLYWDPYITTKPIQYKPPEDKDGTIVEINGIERYTFTVPNDEGLSLHCWLYTPIKPLGGTDPPPVVVTAYGLGVQKDIAMVPFATRMAKEGLAVILFDYSYWGVSAGTPRHISNPNKEIKDLLIILNYLVNSNGINKRINHKFIYLYGSSLGGGIVLATTSIINKDINNKLNNYIKGVVASVPFVSGKAAQINSTKRRSIGESIRIGLAVINDLIRSIFFADSAVYIQLTRIDESEGISAIKIEEDEYNIWASRTPIKGKKIDGNWENKLSARSLFYLSFFQVDDLVVNYLDTPTLIIAGTDDTICPIDPIRNMVYNHEQKKKNNKIQLREFPLRHFDFLTQEYSPLLLDSTMAFFEQLFYSV